MTESPSIPDEIAKAAEQALDSLLCNCAEACGGTEGVRAASILDIATAIHDAVMAERERQWQPIETAPRDGTDILLGSGAQSFNGSAVPARVTIGRWTLDEECRTQIGDCGGECRCPEYEYHDPYWMSWDGGFTTENPCTHWMPLPAPPKAEGE